MTNFEIIDAVQRSLEKEGLLQAVRAQLRASVFKIISNGPDYVPKQNDVAEFASTIEGRACLLLISELFEKLKLTQALSVFQAECGTQAFGAISTKEVEDLLHLPSNAVAGRKSLLERLVARQSGIGSPRESQHSSEAKEYGNSQTGGEYKLTNLTSLPNRRSEFKHSSAQYFEGVPTAKSDDESDHEEPATAQSTNHTTEKGAHPSLLNSKSYDFNEVVEPEEDIEEEYASEEDEQKNDVAHNGTSPDSHSDAKQVALNASLNQEKKQEKKGDVESDEEDGLSVNNSRGGSDWEDDKPVVNNVKSDSNLNGSDKGTSGRGNVSMDISSSFEAEASNSSFSLGNASANRREPLKTLPPVTAPAATRFSESKVSESKANSDSKHDHSESDIEDEVLSEEEGPEVDSEEEEVDQLAQSGRLHTSGDITHVGVSGVTGAHVGAATKKVEVRGAVEDKEEQDVSDSVPASGLGNLVNKAKVMRMNQSATTSRSKTGWGDMSGVNRDNEFDSDRDSDHSPVKGRNNDDLRDISEDNINIEEDFDSRSRPTSSGNMTASSSIPRAPASSSAWGSSPKISKSPVKGPGRHNDTSRDSKVDSSFEAESDEDSAHESNRQLHMSYRSNQEDEEDVIEHEEEEDEEHSVDSREHRSSSEENTRAFTTRDPPSKVFDASTKTQDTKHQGKEDEEDEEEEPEYDDYAEDFEDEEGHDSRNTSRHSDIKFSSSEAGKKTQQLHLSGQKQRYEAEDEELSEVEEIEEDMSVGQNSDEDSDHDTNPVNKHRVESSTGSGMSRGRSGLLPDVPPSTQNHTDNKADTSDFDSNQYFNNDDDEEDGDDGEVDRLGEIERRMAEMEREDATLVNLKRNLQSSNNDASEVYSESGSVASEDIEQDVMEFSAGGDDRSDSEDGF